MSRLQHVLQPHYGTTLPTPLADDNSVSKRRHRKRPTLVSNQKRHGLDSSMVNSNVASVPWTQDRRSALEKVVKSETSELPAVYIVLSAQLNNSADEPRDQELQAKDDNALISRISRRRQERLKSASQKLHDSKKHSYRLSLLSSAWESN